MDDDTLRRVFAERLIEPGHPEYEGARHVWNGAIDRRPRWIARCADAAEIQAAVRWAAGAGVDVALRGGGHSVAGHGVCDGGLVLDLGGMKAVTVDAAARRAQAGPGCTWADLDAATHAHGLATTGGLISTTGIAGLTLGGGIGWLMRKHGLSCDNLLSADVVDAHGDLVHADASQSPELFWALRGGGGNFGVVTRFEYRLHPVSTVTGGMLLFPRARAAEVARVWRDVIASAPDELTSLLAFNTAPPAPFVPPELQGAPAVAVVSCVLGDDAVLAPLRALGPALDGMGVMPYPALQSMLDAGAPAGQRHYWKSDDLAELSDAALDAILAQAEAMPGPLSQIHVHQLGGAVARVGEDETAAGNRAAAVAVNAIATWEQETGEEHIAWARATSAAMRPLATGGVYVNFLGDEGPERVRQAYGAAKLARLAAVKRRHDPRNLFHLNQNVAPTG